MVKPETTMTGTGTAINGTMEQKQEMTKQMVKPGEDFGERDDDGKANKQTVPRLSSPQLRAGLPV